MNEELNTPRLFSQPNGWPRLPICFSVPQTALPPALKTSETHALICLLSAEYITMENVLNETVPDSASRLMIMWVFFMIGAPGSSRIDINTIAQ
jgi:hypothetical protein